jgi:translation initiation factor eIF-2B subunit delta
VLISSLAYVMRDVDLVFVGAYGMLANGTVLARAGTALVGMTAKHFHVPLLVCCETYKFHERVQLDSVCFNELADPDSLIDTRLGGRTDSTDMAFAGGHDGRYNTAGNKASEAEMKDGGGGGGDKHAGGGARKGKGKGGGGDSKGGNNGKAPRSPVAASTSSKSVEEMFHLSDWRDLAHLRLLNLVYDLTPVDFVSMVITEVGMIPPTSVPVVLREHNKVQ